MAHKKTNMTELEIKQKAMRMFFENGFSNTTVKAISKELGISTGNLTFYFPTKEHLLFELTKELTVFHSNCIEDAVKKSHDNLFSYCLEVVAQIVSCESNPNVKDIYLAIYSYPMTLDYIRNWTARKNYKLLGELLPEWSLERFRRAETVTCCIERSALTEECTEEYTLEDKIKLILTCLLKIYDVNQEDRENVINKILKTDYKKISGMLLKQLTRYIEKYNQQVIDEAIKERKAV